MKKPRLLLAGAHSGVGKTSISAGIMSALISRGYPVQPFKVGPDYIDPAFHTFVTGRHSRNLDAWMLPSETLKSLFCDSAPDQGKGLSIIEGVMGLFDGHSETGLGSSAHVASILDAPTILIINGASIARSAAALVHGFNQFQPNFKLAGVIINMVSGRGHYELLKGFIEKEAKVPCFGFLAKNPDFALESRHLGLVPSVEVKNLTQRLTALGQAVTETIDLGGLLELIAASKPLTATPLPPPILPDKPIRIGLAMDKA
ncbi:MAG: cobyrinate a,c-diamide synthase, partial [Candidatus Adiutrix sp.]